MDWCKLGAGYYRDPAILRAGEAAEVLFLRALAYCAEHETGGLVSRAVLPMLTPTRPFQRAKELVSAGLWTAEGDDFTIVKWEVWQRELDVAVERKKKDRERK